MRAYLFTHKRTKKQTVLYGETAKDAANRASVRLSIYDTEAAYRHLIVIPKDDLANSSVFTSVTNACEAIGLSYNTIISKLQDTNFIDFRGYYLISIVKNQNYVNEKSKNVHPIEACVLCRFRGGAEQPSDGAESGIGA